MYKLKKLSQVDKNAKIKHSIVLALELLMSLVCLITLIVHIINGDPKGRIPATIGSIFIYFVPLVFELIFKVRLPILAHILFTIHVTLSVYMGSSLGFHNSIGPYDEIMHFLFGYMSSIFFFYIFIAWKDYDRQKPIFMAFVIFIMSLGVAPLWELLELTMDIFLNQTSLGSQTTEIINEGIALGYSGIGLNIYAISHSVLVWDTITDMALHLGGSVLFFIEYMVHRHIKTPLFLSLILNDYRKNKLDFYDFVEIDTLTTTCSKAS